MFDSLIVTWFFSNYYLGAFYANIHLVSEYIGRPFHYQRCFSMDTATVLKINLSEIQWDFSIMYDNRRNLALN